MFQKFGQDVPQSLIDAVSNIMEAKDDEPAAPDADAIARRKRLQAIKDKQEDDAAERGTGEKKSSVRTVAGKAYGGAKQKDDKEEMDESCDCDTKKEELIGGQKKLDKNHNGKLDADDFKKLRKEETLDEKAVSTAQQKFMGMVYKAKKSGKAASPEVAKAAAGMSKKAAHDYAATKHKGLPQHKEEVQLEATDKKDLPFDADDKGPSAIPGKQGLGPSTARHLARQGLKKFLKKETMMGKAGCTSEETDLEESRAHKILATKLRQIDTMSSGIAPDHNTNVQSTKDKIKDAKNIGKVEIVTQKDTSVRKEEVEQINEGDYYHEKVAKALPKGLKTDGEILKHAHDHMQKDLKGKYSPSAIHRMVHAHHDNDFPSDLVSHYHHINKTNEEVEQIDETAALDQYIKSMGYDPEHMDKNKKVMFSKTNAFKTWASTKQEGLYDAGQKGTQDIDTHMSPGATARG